MYKFIDFNHFQSIKENDIFCKIMWFLLFLYNFCKFLVADLLLQFVAESIRLFWIKWLKSLFKEAENDSYYRMLLSWLFSTHACRPTKMHLEDSMEMLFLRHSFVYWLFLDLKSGSRHYLFKSLLFIWLTVA